VFQGGDPADDFAAGTAYFGEHYEAIESGNWCGFENDTPVAKGVQA